MIMEAVIEVFKTNVADEHSAGRILAELGVLLPGYRINFDLQDCDKILRVEGDFVDTMLILAVLEKNGFACEVLQ